MLANKHMTLQDGCTLGLVARGGDCTQWTHPIASGKVRTNSKFMKENKLAMTTR